MATLKPLLVLKSNALKSLAVSIGVNCSGTKPQVASRIVGACCDSVPFFERLQGDVQRSSRRVPKEENQGKREKRVLSIDMGIRNLAMCILEVPNHGSREVGKKGKREKRGRSRKEQEVMESFPKILAWERITVAERPVADEESPSSSPPPPPPPLPIAEEIPGLNGAEKKTGKTKANETQPEKLPLVTLEEEVTNLGKLEKRRGKRKAKNGQPEESSTAPLGEILAVSEGGERGGGGGKATEIQLKESLPGSLEESTAPDGTEDEEGEVRTDETQLGELSPALPQREEIPNTNEGEKKRKGRKAKFIPETPVSLLLNPYSAPDLDPEVPGQEEGKKREKNEGKKPKKAKKKVESFEPSVYALLANSFVRQLLARFSPLDVILIERQRYRSHGAPAIQEWTVRVNMLEAMLHAVFYCLHGGASPAAESVNPDRVTRFWVDRVGEKHLEVKKPGRRKKKDLEDDLGDELGLEGVVEVVERQKSYRKTKLAKISLVTEWLERGDVVALGEDVRDVAADFIPPAKGKRRKKPKSTNGGKLDDLADCLLQGMAWIRWEENRRNLAEGRVIPEFVPCKNLDL